MAINLSTFLPGWGTGTLAVEVAWGADLSAEPGTWSWSDITTDVRIEPGISATKGRSDEASTTQPAECTLVLDNSSGDYSLGGESTNWPYVRQGTPIRIRIDPDGDGYLTVFHGSAVSWTPTWDTTGNIPAVELVAGGEMRRLEQGQAPLASSLRREMSSIGPLIYWPCEDGDETNAFFAAVGPHFLTWSGTPDLAANTDFIASTALPVMKAAKFFGKVPPYTSTGEAHVTMLVEFPEETSPSCVFVRIWLNDVWKRIEFRYDDPGGLEVRAYNSASTEVYAGGRVEFDLDINPRARRLSITLTQTGADLDVAYSTIDQMDPFLPGGASDLITGFTMGIITAIEINPEGLLDDVVFGHVAVLDTVMDSARDEAATGAWRRERAGPRIDRLAGEEGETITRTGLAMTRMGPQSVETFLGLVRECELADGGILYDGDDAGLSYLARTERENRPADLTIDAAAGELAEPFSTTADDQRRRNRAVVTRDGAETHTFEDTAGNLGTAAVGIYETSLTVNAHESTAAQDLASWLVAAGTVEGYRYPAVSVDLRAAPALARDTLSLAPGRRLDIENVDSTLSHHPGGGPLSLAVEGLEMEIAAGILRATAKCSPYDPWRIATLATDTLSQVLYRTSGVTDADDNATVTAALPATYAVGDLLVIVASIRNSGTGTVNTPAGWTVLLTAGNVKVLGKVATESESPVNVTFSGGAANATTLAQMFALGGTAAHRLTNLADVVHASAAQLNASAQNCAMPALTVSEDNCGILAIVWKASTFSSASNPYGYTTFPVVVSSSVGDDACQFAAWGVQSTASNLSAGTYTITGGSAAISRGLVLAFLPDPTPPPLAVLDTVDSELASGISAGATSISVTNSGPRWTTDADDYPLDLDIAGVRFTATACVDATSPQIMTVQSAPVARSAGAPVRLWRPPALSR